MKRRIETVSYSVPAWGFGWWYEYLEKKHPGWGSYLYRKIMFTPGIMATDGEKTVVVR